MSGLKTLSKKDNERERYCFLTTPLRDKKFEKITNIVRQVLSENNVKLNEFRDISPGSEWAPEITRLIKNSSLMIADITGQNSNVMFELGLAQGAGVPTIVICERGSPYPSDLAGQLLLLYETSSKFDMETFSTRLGEAVRSFWDRDEKEVLSSGVSLDEFRESAALADEAIKSQNYTEAEGILKTLLGSDIAETEPNIRVYVLHQLGLIAQRRGENTLALRYLQEEIEILRDLELPDQTLSAYANLANVLQDMGDLDQAEVLYREALEISKGPDDRSTQAIILSNLGSLATKRSALDEAEALFREALSILEETADRSLLARAYVNLATIKENRGELDDAEAIFRQALEYFVELGDKHSASGVMNNLASVQMSRGDNQSAEVWLRESLDIKQALGDVRGSAASFQNLANVSFRTARYSEAIDYIRRVIDIRQRMGDRHGLLQALGLLASILEKSGEVSGANSVLREALSIADEIGSKESELIRERLESAVEKNA